MSQKILICPTVKRFYIGNCKQLLRLVIAKNGLEKLSLSKIVTVISLKMCTTVDVDVMCPGASLRTASEIFIFDLPASLPVLFMVYEKFLMKN